MIKCCCFWCPALPWLFAETPISLQRMGLDGSLWIYLPMYQRWDRALGDAFFLFISYFYSFLILLCGWVHLGEATGWQPCRGQLPLLASSNWLWTWSTCNRHILIISVHLISLDIIWYHLISFVYTWIVESLGWHLVDLQYLLVCSLSVLLQTLWKSWKAHARLEELQKAGGAAFEKTDINSIIF